MELVIRGLFVGYTLLIVVGLYFGVKNKDVVLLISSLVYLIGMIILLICSGEQSIANVAKLTALMTACNDMRGLV